MQIVSKHQVFMDNALSIAQLSKCVSMQVGVVAVNERGRIIATGVNGTPANFKNCCDVHKERGAEHSAWSELYEIHAEMNTILELARGSATYQMLDFYTTHCPCSNCLKHMVGLHSPDSFVRSIIYNEVYYRTPLELLAQQKEFCLRFGVTLMSIQEAVSNDLKRFSAQQATRLEAK